MRILKIIPDSVVDGPGSRTSIYFAGGKVQGDEFYPAEIIHKVEEYGNKNVTITGENPLNQEHLFHIQVLCEHLKREGYNIWLYTEYTWEQLMRQIQDFMWHPKSRYIELMKILDNIDVLVSNQRIIDVQQSLKRGEVVLYKEI